MYQKYKGIQKLLHNIKKELENYINLITVVIKIHILKLKYIPKIILHLNYIKQNHTTTKTIKMENKYNINTMYIY